MRQAAAANVAAAGTTKEPRPDPANQAGANMRAAMYAMASSVTAVSTCTAVYESEQYQKLL